MSTIVAIGGGELKDLETLSLDRTIVGLAKKKCPEVLFIPTASNDSIGYWETFQNVYGKKLGCKTSVLFLVRENLSEKQIREKIFSADIIYVGGGNTLKMLRIWRQKKVDILLRKAYEKGTILSGLSTGAIAWFRYGLSDSRRFMKNKREGTSFMRVSALGFLPFMISPHHIREKRVRDREIKEVMRRTPGVALTLDDNSAILFQDDSYRILRSRPEVVVKKVFCERGKIYVKTVGDSGAIQALITKD